MVRALLLAAATLPPSWAATCPAGWLEVGEHCFWMSATQHTFESCQLDVCGPKNATLACIRAEESDELVERLGFATRQADSDDLLAAWIGFTRATPDRQWVWISGCQSDWTDWLSPEPNDYCGGEDCAVISGAGGAWLDVSCRLRMHCLCEYPTETVGMGVVSVPLLRDDTCYADCGDLTRWCSAWPFFRLFEVTDDICNWEPADGLQRGRGANQCASHAASHPECGYYLSYSVGRCRCSPASGLHANCSHREPDVASDVFVLSEDGPQMVYPGQRCVYALDIDSEFFVSLRPAGSWGGSFRMWLRAAAIWLAFGLPCGLAMAWMSWRVLRRPVADPGSSGSASGGFDGGAAPGGAAYGPLIDTGGEEGASDVVNRWIFRAASGTILYGLAQLALGATLAAHMAGRGLSFALELLEALAMAMAMMAVTRAACMVHRRLSPIAKEVAGPWVLVVSLASLGLAMTALFGVAVFSTLADGDYENICFAQYLFRWSMLLALPLQCLAGSAVAQLQCRVARYAAGEAYAGGWVTLLASGYFGAGMWVWWAGYLDCVHEAGLAVALCFVAAASSQLLAGLSLLMVNWKIKQHFRRGEADQAAVPPATLGATDFDPAPVL